MGEMEEHWEFKTITGQDKMDGGLVDKEKTTEMRE